MKYWLMKSEPEEFSIADLAKRRLEPWSGVRSMFARFHMRNMTVGDAVLFYHSSCNPPGVAGLATVSKVGVIDETQFDPDSKYFDEKSTREKPRWDCVEVAYVKTLPHLVQLERIRGETKLADMVLLKQGRLSVQPVAQAEYEHIVALAETAWEPPVKPKPVKKAAVNKKPPATKTTTKKKTTTTMKKMKKMKKT